MTKYLLTLAFTSGLLYGQVFAEGATEAHGLWLTPQGDAVIQFAPCAEPAGSLCGTIVWDKDAGTSTDTCGIRIAQLARYEKDAWREGWVFDPRDGRKYKGLVRVKGNDLKIRAFLGVEILGQTEQLRRVTAMPDKPRCSR